MHSMLLLALLFDAFPVILHTFTKNRVFMQTPYLFMLQYFPQWTVFSQDRDHAVSPLWHQHHACFGIFDG